MGKIDRKDFPVLDQLLWDTRERYFDSKDVLEIYERRWPFVDKNRLSEKELQLINTLAFEVGGFLPASA